MWEEWRRWWQGSGDLAEGGVAIGSKGKGLSDLTQGDTAMGGYVPTNCRLWFAFVEFPTTPTMGKGRC